MPVLMYFKLKLHNNTVACICSNVYLGVVHKLREQVRGEGGVLKMFTLLYNPYLVNWFTRGEGGVKTGQNLVHVVCERPHTIEVSMTKSTSQSLCTYLVLQFYTCPNMSSLQTNFSLSHECNLNEKFFSGKVPDRRIPSHFCLKQSFDSKQSNAKVRYLYYYLIGKTDINCPKGYGHKWPIRGNDSG